VVEAHRDLEPAVARNVVDAQRVDGRDAAAAQVVLEDGEADTSFLIVSISSTS
jgi:hypothetical protein